MAFRFDVQETFLKAFPRIARERIDRVIESLNEKPQPGAESIHDARKNLKSLRALLRLARASIDDTVRRREDILFRDVGRSLSAVRDPQALLEAVEYFSKRLHHDSAHPTPKQESIRAFIKKIHREIGSDLVGGSPPGSVRKLVRELRAAKRRAALWFESVVLRPGNEWEFFVGTGLRKTYRKAKNLVWQIEVIGREKVEDQAWHDLRKCSKALGYQVRLLKPIWPAIMDTLVEELDQLTDRLGDANDLAILGGRILNQPYDPSETKESAEPRRNCLQLLDLRKRKLHSEAFDIARLIYAEKPGQFERRLAEYWQIWRSRVHGKGARRSARVDARPGYQENRVQNSKSEPLAPSSVTSAQ